MPAGPFLRTGEEDAARGEKLIAAGTRLLAVCKTLEGHPNKDLQRFIKEINKLADHMEN